MAPVTACARGYTHPTPGDDGNSISISHSAATRGPTSRGFGGRWPCRSVPWSPWHQTVAVPSSGPPPPRRSREHPPHSAPPRRLPRGYGRHRGRGHVGVVQLRVARSVAILPAHITHPSALVSDMSSPRLRPAGQLRRQRSLKRIAAPATVLDAHWRRQPMDATVENTNSQAAARQPAGTYPRVHNAWLLQSPVLDTQ